VKRHGEWDWKVDELVLGIMIILERVFCKEEEREEEIKKGNS
jgi:hypothetical protein